MAMAQPIARDARWFHGTNDVKERGFNTNRKPNRVSTEPHHNGPIGRVNIILRPYRLAQVRWDWWAMGGIHMTHMVVCGASIMARSIDRRGAGRMVPRRGDGAAMPWDVRPIRCATNADKCGTHCGMTHPAYLPSIGLHPIVNSMAVQSYLWYCLTINLNAGPGPNLPLAISSLAAAGEAAQVDGGMGQRALGLARPGAQNCAGFNLTRHTCTCGWSP